MAESILSDLAVGLISKAGSLLLDEIVLWRGVKDEVSKFKETVDTIKAVLLDAEEKSSHNHEVQLWLGKLSEAMYDAEDLLDEFSYEALHQQLMGGSGTSKNLCCFFSSCNQFAAGQKMAHKVKHMRERLNEIAANRSFHLEERSYVFVPPQTHSSPPQVVIGREHDKARILELLHSSNCVENVSVVAVVGIGGVGKTTLAQMVYNDDRVNHFELKMWVCVSDNFDVQLLVKNVIESASGKALTSTQMDELKKELHKHINGKRYLLVLDDVWNEEVNKWSSFIDLFADGAKGSKILITTRSIRVAETSRAVAIHEIEDLPEEESWSLFKQVAFSQKHQLNPSREAIGREIVKKCCGVPLAIKTIAGVLYSKDPDTEWKSLKDNEMSKIDEFKKEIEPILRLSYNHLPSPYKRCFAYCCLFPKDFRIPVDKLIQLWEAQGYVQPTNENESVRDVGLKYFKDLLGLSFFQDVVQDDLGNIKYCKMHDLMHDLAVSVAGDNFSLPSSDRQMTSYKNNSRHMSFWRYNMQHQSSWLKMKNMRTLFGYSVLDKGEADAIFCYLRRLRVLDLSLTRISTLPNSINKMKLLRYLDLSGNSFIEELPNSLTNLHNLQGLNLEGCSNLRKWPSDISKLVNLTDLNNGGCFMLKYIPSGIGKLTKLEKLPEFVMEEDQSILKHGAGLDELHSLDNLRGELVIKNLGFVGNAASELREGLLSSKQNLQELKLDWGDHYANNVGDQEIVMEALCPHPNLKALEVFEYEGLKPPGWLPSITNLVEVKINCCRSIQKLPPINQLPHLKTLEIEISELESIEVEYGRGSSSFFPSLTHLTLNYCPKLKGFERLSSLSKEEIPPFPCLSYLYIVDCPNLIHLPLSAELEILEAEGVKSLIEILMMPTNSAITLSKLQHLQIYSCSSIQRLPPINHLPHLKTLDICFMSELESIEVEYGRGSSSFFPSLTDLTLHYCPKLKGFERLSSLSKEELPPFPCLSYLYIHACPNLIHLPLSAELEELQVKGVKSLNEILMMPTNSAITLSKLQDLRISDIENMVSLPKGLQHATTLQRLHISGCPSLKCIPEWMPKLIALQELNIDCSPKVEERCNNNSAEDWHKISDIPNIRIGREQIQSDSRYLL